VSALRTLIVDDEPLAREGIRHLLEKDEGIEVVGECSDGLQAVEVIETTRPDLVFLDIQMPELDGFEVLEKIGAQSMPVVVFVTAYDEYAIRAFNVHALDYLLKPIDPERFALSLARARTEISLRRNSEFADKLTSLLHHLRHPRQYLDRIMIKQPGKISFLETREVDWFEAEGDYVQIHVQERKHLIRERIGELEQKLDPKEFARIHRSTIVNLGRVREMQPLFSGDYVVILHGGQRLGLSRTYRDRLFASINPSS